MGGMLKAFRGREKGNKDIARPVKLYTHTPHTQTHTHKRTDTLSLDISCNWTVEDKYMIQGQSSK